ncbi:MAG: tetratricopeptide repeat protein [Gemmatimonadales bacterium]|nr:tetratricopeptide repeat protein [Gemmatimonadales bacterium]
MTNSGHSSSDALPTRMTVWILAGVSLIPLIIGVLLAWHSLSDIDIWFHNRVGRELLSGEGPPTNSDFTFSAPEHPWTNHEFLFQLMIAPLGPGGPLGEDDSLLAVDVSGWNFMRTGFSALILLLLIFGDGRLLLLRSRTRLGWNASWWSLPLLVGLMLLWPRLIFRPELISYVFFIIAVRRIENAMRPTPCGDAGTKQPEHEGHWSRYLNPRHDVGAIFWLTVFWAWFHGFAAAVPVIWLLGGILSLLQTRIYAFRTYATPAKTKSESRISLRTWLLVLGLSLAGLALTPNGINGLLYPLKALGQFSNQSVDMRLIISELAPLLETRNSLHWTLWTFRLSLVWSALWILFTWGRISLLRIALLIITATAAVLGQRNLGFYALAFCLLHSGYFSAAVGTRFSRLLGSSVRKVLPKFPPVVPLALGAMLTIAIGAWWGSQIISDRFYLREGVSRRFGTELTPSQYPMAGAQRIRETSGDRVFANLGGAALLLDRAEAHLFIDGRTEAFPPALWAQYRQIRRGGDKALLELERIKAQQVLIGGGGSAFQQLTADLLAHDRWRLELVEEGGWLFFKTGTEHRAETDLLSLAKEADRLENILIGESESIPGSRFADRCLAISRLWKMAGEPDRQEATLRRGLERRADHPPLLHNLGNKLMERQQFARAREYFNGALRENPNLAGSALNLGACLLSEKRPSEATKAFARAVRINPDLFEAWVNLGIALEQSGQREKSKKAFEKALKLRPQDERLRHYLSTRSR